MPDPVFSSRFPMIQKEPAKLITPASLFVAPVQLLQANFSTDFVSGVAPLEILFFDQSIGRPTAWLWDFGDGGASTLQNPRHTYLAWDSYKVCLTVSNVNGTSTACKNRLIVVSQPSPPQPEDDLWPENDQFPLGFYPYDWPTWVVDTDIKHTGSASMRSQEADLLPAFLRLDFTGDYRNKYIYEAGQKYSNYFWYLTEPEAEFCYVLESDLHILPATDIWKKVHINFTAASTLVPNIGFYEPYGVPKRLWVDGFSLIKRNWLGEPEGEILYDN